MSTTISFTVNDDKSVLFKTENINTKTNKSSSFDMKSKAYQKESTWFFEKLGPEETDYQIEFITNDTIKITNIDQNGENRSHELLRAK